MLPEPPTSAAWTHVDSRVGFEVVFIVLSAVGMRVDGQTTAVEQTSPWAVRYSIDLDANWRTRAARVTELSADGERRVRLEADGEGSWRIDGGAAPELDGCLDVDLGASAFTNALPVSRLGLAIGESARAPTAYVGAPGLTVDRLEQRYTRLSDDDGLSRYAYAAPDFDFTADLTFDGSGLVLDYPRIAVRVA